MRSAVRSFSVYASAGLVLAALLSGIQACSSSSSEPRAAANAEEADSGTTPPAAPDAADDVDAAVTDPDAGAACNSVTQLGSPFDILGTKAAAPAPEGGTVEDGIWVNTSAKLWGSTEAEGIVYARSGASTLSKHGARFDSVSTDLDGEEVRESGSFVTSGTDYTLTADCPTGDNRPNETKAKYTATPTTLTIYVDAPFGGGVMEIAYIKK